MLIGSLFVVVPRQGNALLVMEVTRCSARHLREKAEPALTLKTKAIPCGAAAIGSARPAMVGLSGGVDGGGVGVGVGSQCGVVLSAEHVEQSTVST